ncbi:MAG TPA: sulfate ABC transporter substrate-binding protein [Solirubrobacterales bacterium]|jgi:sulfate/thiosulfate transport system substrate-binding protein
MRKPISPGRRRYASAIGAAIFLLTALLATVGCGSSNDNGSGGGSGGKVDVVGYSTPETVYTDGLQPTFQKTPAGKGVSFSDSFGASGDQSRAVVAGQSASLVHFSQAGDMTKLVDAGIVDSNWDQNKYKGIAEDSVVVLVVRKGNPKGIHSFDDVINKDVSVVTPNPFSSGSARWNIMAIYGSQLAEGKSPTQALDAVKTVLSKAKAQPGSGSDALTAFTQGQGDVLLSYENEAIKAQQAGEKVDYVIPDDTILIETPIAVTKDAPTAAQKFLDFIWSDAGQRIWADNGYRPVNPKLVDPQKFPTPTGLFTIDKFGGWDKVNTDFFDETNGKVAKIEADLGVSTAG